MRLEQNPPSPRFGNRRKLCNRHAIVHNPYVGSMQSVLDSSMDTKPPPSAPTLASFLSQSSHMFRLGTTPNNEGSGGEWAGRSVTRENWPCVTGGWSGGVSRDQFLPRSTKRNAYVGILRHAPATTNGLKDIWDDNPSQTNGRRNRSGPLLSQVDLSNRMNAPPLLPSDLNNLEVFKFTLPGPSQEQTATSSPTSTISSNSSTYSVNSPTQADVVEKKKSFISSSDFCVICQSTFQPKDKIMALHCQHCFHRSCINKWMLNTKGDSKEQTNFCPTCRVVVSPNSKPKPQPPPPPTVNNEKEQKAQIDNITGGGAEEEQEAQEEEGSIPAWSFAMLGAKLYTLDTRN